MDKHPDAPLDRHDMSSSSEKKSSLSSPKRAKPSFSRSRSRSQPKRTRYRSRSKEEERKPHFDKHYSRSKPSRPGGYEEGLSKFRSSQSKKQKKVYMPMLDGPLVSYRTFMENQPTNIDREQAEELYEIYRKDWENKQYEIFFGEHKDEQWFKEKYNHLFAEKFKAERQHQAVLNSTKFLGLLAEGFYDHIDLQIEQKTLAASLKKGHDDSDEPDDSLASRPVNFFTEIYLDTNILLAPYFGFDPNCMTLFIKAVPKNISRWEILDTLEKVPGFLSLSLSEPLKSHDFSRFGWILFDSEENCNKAAYDLNNFMIHNHVFNIVKSRSQRKPIKVTTKLDADRLQKDRELSRKLVLEMDQEKAVEPSLLACPRFQEMTALQQLDLQLLYLRKVHSYCYYCAAEHYDERMLAAKCGSIHLRLSPQLEPINVPDWHKKMVDINEKRVAQCLTAPQEHPSLQLEKELEAKLEKKIQKKSQDYQDNIWPCVACEKIFQSMVFVVKHIRNKHEKTLQDMKDRLIEQKMYEAYVKDPHRMMGPSQAAAQNPFPVKFARPNRREYKNYPVYEKKDYKDYDEPQAKTSLLSNKGSAMINYNDI